MNRAKEISKIEEFLKLKFNHLFSKEENYLGRLTMATELVDAGIRSKDGFEIKDYGFDEKSSDPEIELINYGK